MCEAVRLLVVIVGNILLAGRFGRRHFRLGALIIRIGIDGVLGCTRGGRRREYRERGSLLARLFAGLILPGFSRPFICGAPPPP